MMASMRKVHRGGADSGGVKGSRLECETVEAHEWFPGARKHEWNWLGTSSRIHGRLEQAERRD
jgi:hypothetical protein